MYLKKGARTGLSLTFLPSTKTKTTDQSCQLTVPLFLIGVLNLAKHCALSVTTKMPWSESGKRLGLGTLLRCISKGQLPKVATCLALTGGNFMAGILICLNSKESCLVLTVPLPMQNTATTWWVLLSGKLGTGITFLTSAGKSWTWWGRWQ